MARLLTKSKKTKRRRGKRAKRQDQLKRMTQVVMLDTDRKRKWPRDRNITDIKEEKHEKKDELKSMAREAVLDTDGWESGTSKGQLCINFFLLLSPFSPAFLSHASLGGGSVQTLCHNCWTFSETVDYRSSTTEGSGFLFAGAVSQGHRAIRAKGPHRKYFCSDLHTFLLEYYHLNLIFITDQILLLGSSYSVYLFSVQPIMVYFLMISTLISGSCI